MFRIHICLAAQNLTLFDGESVLRCYHISSGEKGVGCQKGSGQTPTGRHVIRAKVGGGLPENTVFIARRPTGEVFTESLAESEPGRDWILSRILWLSGCELGKNRLGEVDTMQRYIYIHGTPDSEPMGIPKSHGCIRMRNRDIMELFDIVPLQTPVTLSEGSL